MQQTLHPLRVRLVATFSYIFDLNFQLFFPSTVPELAKKFNVVIKLQPR